MRSLCFLVVRAGLFLVPLVLIIAVYGILGGKSVVMGSLLDHERVLLLALFRYPGGSGRALLAGTLPLRYCSTRFACMTPSWRLPVLGSVSILMLVIELLLMRLIGMFVG